MDTVKKLVVMIVLLSLATILVCIVWAIWEPQILWAKVGGTAFVVFFVSFLVADYLINK